MKQQSVVSLIVLAVVCFGAMGPTGCTEDKLIEIAVKAEMFEDWLNSTRTTEFRSPSTRNFPEDTSL